jgi:hypothetical protein
LFTKVYRTKVEGKGKAKPVAEGCTTAIQPLYKYLIIRRLFIEKNLKIF